MSPIAEVKTAAVTVATADEARQAYYTAGEEARKKHERWSEKRADDYVLTLEELRRKYDHDVENAKAHFAEDFLQSLKCVQEELWLARRRRAQAVSVAAAAAHPSRPPAAAGEEKYKEDNCALMSLLDLAKFCGPCCHGLVARVSSA